MKSSFDGAGGHVPGEYRAASGGSSPRAPYLTLPWRRPLARLSWSDLARSEPDDHVAIPIAVHRLALTDFVCDSSAYAQYSAIVGKEERTSCGDFASKLTRREHEIAVLVARDYMVKDIAHTLKISEWKNLYTSSSYIPQAWDTVERPRVVGDRRKRFQMQRIALLSVGTMGAGMAANWLKKCFPRRPTSASTMSWARGLSRSRLWTSRLGEREFRTRGS